MLNSISCRAFSRSRHDRRRQPREILFRIFSAGELGGDGVEAIITFIGAWNAFLWPFLAVTHEEMESIAVGINSLGDTLRLSAISPPRSPVCRGVVYSVFQRRVTQAIVLSAGIKGQGCLLWISPG